MNRSAYMNKSGLSATATLERYQHVSWWILPFLLAACVTVNVYFPAPEVDAAAEKMVREIWKEMGHDSKSLPQSPSESLPSSESSPASSSENSPQSYLTPGKVLTVVLDWMVEPAYAGANLNVSTASIRRLQGRLKSRAQKNLKPYLHKGVIGINRSGDMEIRNPGSLPLKDRANVRRLVSADNQDRASLYREIAAANNHPEWEKEIRSRFALKWHSQALKGWWVQGKKGSWKKK